MTEQQKLFCGAFTTTGDALEAAKTAGYKDASKAAKRLMGYQHVLDFIAELERILPARKETSASLVDAARTRSRSMKGSDCMTDTSRQHKEDFTFIEAPLYVTIPKAAKIAGVSSYEMRTYVYRVYEPIPHIVVGEGRGKHLVEVAGIKPWMRRYVQEGAQVDYPDCEPTSCPCIVRSYLQGLEATTDTKSSL